VVAPQQSDAGSSHPSHQEVERFRPTSGRFTGIVLLVSSSAVVVLALVRPDHVLPEVGVGAVFTAILAWTVALRPRVSLVGDSLELRGPVDTVAIPLAAVEQVAVRQLLVVRAGDKRYTSTALSRPRRQLLKAKAGGERVAGPDTDPLATVATPSYPVFVEDRIRQRMDDARAAAGIRRGSPEQEALAAGVQRRPAWPEIVGLAASGLATVLVIAL
jgi:hypothetical protein